MTLGLLATAAAALPPRSADQALLQRVLDEQAVARALPEPSWLEYFWHVLLTAVEAVVQPVLARLGGLPVGGVARALAIAALAVVILLAVGLAVRFLRRRRAAAADPAGASAAPTPEADEAARPAASWRDVLEARLAAGDVAGAVEALWWWLAITVSREPVDASWTTRELLARAGRSDLRALGTGLDRLTYAAARPRPDDVRAFVDRLQAAL